MPLPHVLLRCLLRCLFALTLLGPAWLAPVSAASGSGGGSGAGSGSSDADVPGEILVKLKSTGALQPLLVKYPVTLTSSFGARPIYRLKVVGAARVKDVLAAFALEPDVMLAETNPTHRSPEARKNVAWTIGTPQGYAAQWAPHVMRLAQAQTVTIGTGVRVAVIDTGVDRSHPLLAGRLLPGFDFVDFDSDPSEAGGVLNAGYGHGTHVAGLVALVAPGARIMPVRALDADGVGNAWVLAEALLYALDPDANPDTDDGAHIINLSLGSLARTRLFDTIARLVNCTPSVPDDATGDLSDAGYGDDKRRCANSHGVVIVAAAGNDASGSLKEYPAAESASNLLAVAATTPASKLASFSNFGSWVNLAAPGDSITSSLPGGLYGTWSGTSMAAPLAAGTAALVRSLDLTLRPQDVVQRLRSASAMLCGTQLRQVDAAAAVANVVPAPIACP